MSADDARRMDEALALARNAYGQTSPNPMVGAVVTRGTDVLGNGWHARAGLPHAEPRAIAAARERTGLTGMDAPRDWTLHVNLEPCTHTGRTPPCIDAILAAPIGRVVIAMVDPDPRVAGRGIEALRGAGIEVEVGCGAGAARELNHPFVARAVRQRPFVALKVALSADDCIAAADKSPVSITGPAAKRHTHWVRAGLDGILVGAETLRRDRPRLDRRFYDGPAGSEPRRIVLDPELRSDPGWLWPGEARSLLVCSAAARDVRGRQLERVADLLVLDLGRDGLDLEALPAALAGKGIHSLLVEGGGSTHRRFLTIGLWDRFYLYRNPTLELHGLAWEARSAWTAASATAGPPRLESLDETRLEVTDAPGLDRPS